jgi:hypothetical protein
MKKVINNWHYISVYLAGMVALLAIFLPVNETQKCLLAAMMFLFAEVFMHLVLFNVKLKTIYNAGLITGVFGTAPIGIYYFVSVYEPSLFKWYDFAIAVIWFIACFVFCFRSKLYWGLGRKEGYTLIDQSAFGAGYLK